MLAELLNARETVDCESPSLLATICAVTAGTTLLRLLSLFRIDLQLSKRDARPATRGDHCGSAQSCGSAPSMAQHLSLQRAGVK